MYVIKAIATCSLGKLLVGRSDRGLCKVSLGESVTELNNAFAIEYPNALCDEEDRFLNTAIDCIRAYLHGRSFFFNLPLDVQGTAFQQRVWNQLKAIPYGRTCTYSEIASANGQPKSVRAVARACAANPLALIVPCHRVIRKDGSLGGYRWGLERKEILLAREANNIKKITDVS